MKKTILISIIIVLIFTASCTGNTEPVSRTGFYLGTIITVTVYGENADSMIDKAFSEIERLEKILSKNIESSDISKINANAGNHPVQTSQEAAEVISKGISYYEKSEGFFDITIGPLVDLWKIGTPDAAVPDELSLSKAIELISSKKLTVAGNEIMLEEKGMLLDTGGIAKGYIADKIGELLNSEGCRGAVINLGGNVLTVGEKPDGEKWRIGIQDPFKAKGEYMFIVEIGEMSVVTSGSYERFFEEDGIRYHHILDPFTGYPAAADIAGVSVISNKSIDGDGFSTAVYVMGLEKGMALIEKTPDTECLVIMNDGEIFMSTGFDEFMN